MARIQETVITAHPQDEVFAFVAEFANIVEWDPGVVSSKKCRQGVADREPTGVGTSYELVVSYGGRRYEMIYEVIEWEPSDRVVLLGHGDRVKAVDTIEFAPTNGGTEIRYTAEITLTGIGRLAMPFLGKFLAQIGTAAASGLKARLSAPIAPEPESEPV
jgi:hypothetical protein